MVRLATRVSKLYDRLNIVTRSCSSFKVVHRAFGEYYFVFFDASHEIAQVHHL